jgi:hypothetical protein
MADLPSYPNVIICSERSLNLQTGSGPDAGGCAEGCRAGLQVAQRRVRDLGEWLPVAGRRCLAGSGN